jgi:acyl transferase domain-containing protein/aryl carrier-like protein
MSLSPEPSLNAKDGIQRWLVSRLSQRLGIEPQAIDVRERWSRHGLDSMGAMRLLGELAELLGRPLSPTLVWEYPTVEALARHLGNGGDREPIASAAVNAGASAGEAVGGNEPIAVVGMACRFPKAPDLEAFWRLLRDGVDAITEVPRDRWDIEALYDDDPGAPGKMSTRWGGFLDQVDRFDAPFFGISPREAVPMDPQQRLALELSWEALEDAGTVPSSLKGSPTGVFFGAMWGDYARLPGNDREHIAQHTATGQDLSIVPARVSYTLGLTGPSLAVNTACSSSLVAVHLARQSLQRGESRMALAGGVNLVLAPESTIAMSKFGAMAPDGRSKAFDARANGYVRGEGGGVVVLKRLGDALADGDRIYCVIRGSAINNDGFSNGLTAPNPRAQEAVVRDACASAGVAPAEVQYVEAHGTGTMLGDPIEAGALGAVLGVGRARERALRIGSVKTNIGHLEAAAGMAGLIKVALSMQHRALPPSLHFQRPNPHIAFDALGLQVQAALTPWEGEDGRLLAGVSSFGFGGTNSHVVVEASVAHEPRLFVLSAESEDGLTARARELAEALATAEGPSLEAVCDEAARGTLAAWRLSVVVGSRAELGRHLGAFGRGQASPAVAAGRAATREPRVAFVFGGQGSQWEGMGRALLEEDAARAVLERCDRAMRAYVPWSLLERLRRGDAGLFDRTDFVQPAIFAVQLALAAAWRARGVEPCAVVGQSLGEVAAACVAGALSLDDAARIICVRSQLVAGAAGKGGMAVVGLSLEATAEALSSHGGRLSVAVSSGPEATVVAGDEPALRALLGELGARGVFCRPVRVDYASHSAQMDPLLPELRRALATIAPHRGSVAFYSTVLAAPLDGAALSASYWARNLREPVLFAPVVRRLAEEGIEVFVEIDPHPVLAPAVEQCLAHDRRRGIAVASARREEPARVTLLETPGLLLVAVVPVRIGAEIEAPAGPPAQLVTLSARSAAALSEQAARLRGHLSAHAELGLGDVAFSLATTRGPMEHRLAVVATSREALGAALDAAAEGRTPPGVVRGAAASSRGKLAFLFTGQGAQIPGMGRGLHGAWPAFREAFDRCAALFDRELDRPLREVMWAEPGSAEAALLDQTVYTQPALFALGYALAALWRAWGVEPELLAGHSIGELTAACVAGVFSLEDAVILVAARGRLMQALPEGGAMVSIGAPEAEVAAALSRHAASVSIAAVNGPEQVAIAGDEEAVQAIAASFAARGVRTRRLVVSHAFHSPSMEPMLEAFGRVAGSVTYLRPSRSLVSNVSGALCTDEVSTPGYWVRHVRETVRFADGVRALHEAGADTFIELGPKATLVGLVPACVPDAEPELLASLRVYREDSAGILEALGGFWARGGPVDWAGVFPAGGRRVPLPAYPWQRQRYWIEAHPEARRAAAGAPVVTEGPRDGSPVQPAASRRWRGLSVAEARSSLHALVRGVVAAVLGFADPGALDAGRGFAEQGLDSLMAVETRNRLRAELGVPLPATLAFDHPTVDRLAAHLLRGVLATEMETEAPRNARPAALDEPIAIVGAACRLPGGVEDLDAYWRLLAESGVAITEVPADRWSPASPADFYDPDPQAPGRTYVTKGGFLRDVQGFDAAFFRISPREAPSLDPQQRLLLEVSWEAIERAGQDPAALRERSTGVFVGITTNDYAERLEGRTDAAVELYGGTGTMPSVAAGRLSFFLGLTGPTLAVDTACSSSLVALHLGCQSLRQGECEQALVGGVNALLSPRPFVMLSRWRALSPEGRCKTFSAAADGYARAEGCAVVVLKRLADAERDGDRILAVIRGTAINHDGPSSGLTVPSGPAQEAVLRQALAQAGVAAAEVDFVECHGTGTPLGDPIEVQALGAVYGRGRPAERPLVLGAVKANLGHLEPAAGLAGLLKVLAALEHEQIPAQPELGELNPHIPWDTLGVAVAREAMPWPRGARRRLAGVSAFGMSGTNAHVVVEEARAPSLAEASPARSAELVVLSAKSEAALSAQAARLAAHLSAYPALGLGDVAFSLATARSPMEHRLAVAATSREGLLASLSAAAEGQTPAGAARGRSSSHGVPKVVFVFPGQGSQWLGMGRTLLSEEPVFRAALAECDRVIRAEAGFSVLEELAAGEAASQLGRIDVVQPVLFAVSVALSALWRSWGVTPDAVVGHSLGEVAAAYVAGALSLEDAVRVICRRSRLLRRISGQGEMAVVELSLAEAEAALRGREDRLSVAVSNSPRSTVLSGEPSALAEVLSALEAKGVFCRRVKVDVASHSPQVDPLREELLGALGALDPRQAAVPMRSTVTGASLAGPELGASYWADNLRLPVRFAEAVRALLQDGHGLFVEMSPHPLLVPSVEEALQAAAREGAAVGSLRRGQEERAALLEALGALWARGYPVAWAGVFPAGGRPRARVPLPTYPFQRERYWLEAPPATGRRAHAGGHPLLGEAQRVSTQAGLCLWETTLDLGRLPWLRDHVVQGAVILPGGGYVEMALAAGAEALGGDPFVITDIVLAEALVLAGDTVPVQVVTTEEEPGRVRFQVASPMPGRGSFRVHARGMLRRAPLAEALVPPDLASLRARLGAAVPAAAAYAALGEMGLAYGPAFQGIAALWQGEGEALGRVRLPQAAGSAAAYRLHPALLDACFQVMGGAFAGGGDTTPRVLVGVGSLRLLQRPSGELWCHVLVARDGARAPGQDGADMQILDGTGALVAEVSGLLVQRLSARREEDDWFLELDWERATVPAPTVRSGRWLLLGAGGGVGAALRSALSAEGHEVVHATGNDTSAAAVRAIVAGAFAGRAPTGVVHLGSLDGGGELDPGALEASLVRGCDSVLFTVQALAAMGFRDAPRLWLVTRGAQALGGGVSVTQAPLLGLGRVLPLEHAELRCARIDLDPSRPSGEVAALRAELLADDAEEEVALRGEERRVARLVHRLPEARGRAGSGVAVRRDGSYLLTGGLGGIGLLVAGWLAEQGAGHLVLMGRSGAVSPEQQAAVTALEARGARVTVARADVADRAQVEHVLRAIPASGMPLRGVVHAAVQLADGLLMGQSPARLRTVMAAKALGALHLDALTRETPLDFFVLYGSVAGLLGSPGLGTYAAANTFLDALAHHRRAQGLPALSVDWGAWAEVGITVALARSGTRTTYGGARSLTPGEGLSVLGRLLGSDRAQVGVVPLDARQWVELYPAAASSRMLSQLLSAQRAGAGRPAGDRDLLDRLAAADPVARAGLLQQALRAQVSRVLRIPEGKLDVDAPLTSLGMDSLMGLELRNRIEAALGITVPATLLWTYPTVAALAGPLSLELAGKDAKSNEREAPAPPAPAAVSPELSDDELLEALRSEL